MRHPANAHSSEHAFGREAMGSAPGLRSKLQTFKDQRGERLAEHHHGDAGVAKRAFYLLDIIPEARVHRLATENELTPPSWGHFAPRQGDAVAVKAGAEPRQTRPPSQRAGVGPKPDLTRLWR